MSHALPPVATLSEAWLLGLEHALKAPGGRMVHLVTTIEHPGVELPEIREGLDRALDRANSPSVDSVAQTIFPKALYRDPGDIWSPGMPKALERELDTAANDLYDKYLSMLPILRTDRANSRGTYFSRMISWPGKEIGGVNQISRRIRRIRNELSNERSTHNTLDIDLSADLISDADPAQGTQIYAATDDRTRGFPCLVHVDFTLLGGVLHCLAVYRHHYFVEKTYGNYLGLSWLMQFLCQQTGVKPGELVIHSTLADAQPSHKASPRDLVMEILPELGADTAESTW